MSGFLTRSRLSLDRVVRRVTGPRRGGLATFSGIVRDAEEGRRIASITYDSYRPMAERELGRILRGARKRWKVAAAARHRIGRVPAGEASVVIACAGVHRREAFAACSWIIDEIKRRVPIWKKKFGRKR